MPDTPRYTIMLGTGQRNAWKWLPRGRHLESFEHYLRVAVEAERAGVHGLLLADGLTLDQARQVPRAFEPLTLLAALAARTSRIGLIPTVSTTFNEPFTVARAVNSLDNLSGGRIGVNLVTSFTGEKNYGGTLPRPDDRYARAREFTAVLRKLWSSWDLEAVIEDADSGLYYLSDLVKPIEHVGEHFRVEGPLNVPRSPQGIPGIGAAGSSDLGRQFAAEVADFVYSVQPSKRIAEDYFTDLRRRAREQRADGTRPTVITGVIPIIGENRAQARELAAQLREPSDFEAGRRRIEALLGGADLSGLARTDTIDPAIIPPPDDILRRQGRYEVFKSLAVDEEYTLEELVDYVANTNGHWTVVGTVDDVVAAFAERFDSGLADGFNIWPTHYPHGLDAITGRLLPELQRAGYFTPLSNEPTTFRDLFTTHDPESAPLAASG
ncbi:NtaA/DmoA family FMN-dependent monooxygenase [Mycobacterium sp. 236(2023)]|uniref:NtaA/DmoA family FMN-dependent monooxygenase n=1 Tax=Mycobacterium sp. 236(2023) TaxID=3038163 RepID=UPI00241557B0|nr:NtaA/DmoA family FMN-dependent monooxygenase [Mycobacterium sp. 236(2023)]MDG4667659.1 NtaA/DmoA family FMN-dependent monooxygenase [Mycobacterium sp. 236(2023)]